MRQVQGEEVEPLEAERPELARCGRGVRDGGEDEARGMAAGGVDGDAGRGRRREVRDEGLHLNGGRRGQIGARADEEYLELRRGRGRLRAAFALVLRAGLIPVFVVVVSVAVRVRVGVGVVVGVRLVTVFVVVVVVTVVVGRPCDPIRRAGGLPVLRSAHCCGGGCDGGAVSKGLGEVFAGKRGKGNGRR